jgi:hypothetical protein
MDLPKKRAAAAQFNLQLRPQNYLMTTISELIKEDSIAATVAAAT